MKSNSNNINLQFIGQNQLYQELTLNQNYFIIDSIIKGVAIDINLSSFPTNPKDSDIYIFGNISDLSLSNKIAIFNINLGWILINQQIGMKFYVLSQNTQYIFSNQNQWIVFAGYDENLMNNLISGAKNRANHTGVQDLLTTTTGNLPISRISGLSAIGSSGLYSDLINRPISVGDYKFSVQSVNHGNWILCNGQAILRTSYPQLFALIGTSFGAGNGSTTFNVPNYKSTTIPNNLFIYAM